jgi:hypothetical protein
MGDLSEHVKDEIVADTQELRCTQDGCPGQGTEYPSRQGRRQHVNTVGHIQASSSTARTQTPSFENNTTQLMSPISPISFPRNRVLPSPQSPLAGRHFRTPQKLTLHNRQVNQKEAPSPSVEERLEKLEIAQAMQAMDHANLKIQYEYLKRKYEDLNPEN